MAFEFTGQYDSDMEASLLAFFQSLSEKDRRRFAALEAKRLGYGGTAYIAGVLGCSTKTIERAAAELAALPEDPAAGRVRAPGGGRKKRLNQSRNSNQT
jgi:hypothetical protein